MPVACASPLLHQQYACETLPAADSAFAWHGTHDAAPAPENVLRGHITHAAAALAPVTFEDVPALQFAQDSVPNWPAGHTRAGQVYVSS